MSVHQLCDILFVMILKFQLPWGGDPHLVFLTRKSFEGPKDFGHFQLLFYRFML